MIHALEKLKKNNMLSHAKITKEYKSLIDLYFMKNTFIYLENNELNCSLPKLDILFKILKTQDCLMKKLDDYVFESYGLYPKINPNISFIDELTYLIEYLIVNDEQYNILLKLENTKKVTAKIIKIEKRINKYNKNYLVLIIKYKNRTQRIYAHNNLKKVLKFEQNYAQLIFTNTQYPNLLEAKECKKTNKASYTTKDVDMYL